MPSIKRILITPGEPAGIGPDVTLAIASRPHSHQLIAVANMAMLQARAAQLGINIKCVAANLNDLPRAHEAGLLPVMDVDMNAACVAGKLDTRNADYVVKTLQTAAQLCLSNEAHGIVTGPVHKGILNDADIAFSGHTEFFAECSGTPLTVMLFVLPELKVALLTTHLPLKDVSAAITPERLIATLEIFSSSLKQEFGIPHPRILICGLNPHAGEGGHLGREEIDIIAPTLARIGNSAATLIGPLPADTIFTPDRLANADAVLAMYHDQALPLVKYLGFHHAVNVTLGLPFIRTSVDHGTALDIAGTGKANPESLAAAIQLCALLKRRS